MAVSTLDNEERTEFVSELCCSFICERVPCSLARSSGLKLSPRSDRNSSTERIVSVNMSLLVWRSFSTSYSVGVQTITINQKLNVLCETAWSKCQMCLFIKPSALFASAVTRSHHPTRFQLSDWPAGWQHQPTTLWDCPVFESILPSAVAQPISTVRKEVKENCIWSTIVIIFF